MATRLRAWLTHMFSRPIARAQGRDFASVTTQIGPHLLPLTLVFGASVIGQLAVLTQRPLVSLPSDAPTYIHVAERMLTAHQFLDPYRTPAYPAFLALIFFLTGGEHFTAVVVAQTLLIVAATAEVYLLTWRIAHQRWLAAVVAAVCALDVFITTWERVLMTEALSYWLMVTLFVVLERYLTRPRTRYLIWFTLLAIISILTRPIFLPLPAVLLLTVAAGLLRTHTLHAYWKQLLLAGALAYGAILGYAATNGLVNGYFGVSNASNIDLFARVLRYDMYRLPLTGEKARQYQSLQAQIEAHVNQGGLLAREPWGFVAQYPVYRQHNMDTLGAFSTAEIEQHPLYYLQRSIPDIGDGFYADPFLYAPTSYAPAWIVGLNALFHFSARAFVFFPVFLVVALLRLWRQPHDMSHLLVCLLLVAFALTTLMGTTFSYEGFWRLRFPMEWAVTLVGVLYAVALVRWLARVLAQRRLAFTMAIRHDSAAS